VWWRRPLQHIVTTAWAPPAAPGDSRAAETLSRLTFSRAASRGTRATSRRRLSSASMSPALFSPLGASVVINCSGCTLEELHNTYVSLRNDQNMASCLTFRIICMRFKCAGRIHLLDLLNLFKLFLGLCSEKCITKLKKPYLCNHWGYFNHFYIFTFLNMLFFCLDVNISVYRTVSEN